MEKIKLIFSNSKVRKAVIALFVAVLGAVGFSVSPEVGAAISDILTALTANG